MLTLVITVSHIQLVVKVTILNPLVLLLNILRPTVVDKIP